jgi:hypothetical protein
MTPRPLLLALLLLPAAVPAQGPPSPESELSGLIRRYATDADSVRRFYHLPQSEAVRTRRDGFFARWQEELERQPFERMGRDGRIDFLLLRNHLAAERYRQEFEARRLEETRPLLPFLDDAIGLEVARWGVTPIDPQAAAATLTRIGREAADVHRRVRLAHEKRPAEAGLEPLEARPERALRAARTVADATRALDAWYRHYDGFHPLFSWWNRKPYEAARRALDEYGRFLRETVAGQRDRDEDPMVGDPIGRDAILMDLRFEMLAYSPEELIRIAEREMAWCEDQMRRAAREMGHGDDWKAALEAVKARHVPPGEQDGLVARQAREAIEFLERRDLVTIEPLARETWRVDMIDLATQRILPFAAYGGQRMLVAYPLADMDHDTKLMSLRGNNEHFSRIVTPHELIPGHHLQGYMAQRYRPYRAIFSTPFLGEGWALHWEMLLWDLGYARGPEDRVGMLFWRMHRAARIIVSLAYHMGETTPPEMIDFLVDRVGHERFTATSEVRRYIGGQYSPLYQVSYMIGGLQLRSLYRALVPAKMTPKQFHDAVLKENSVPIEMIRLSLTGTTPPRDWRPEKRL